MQLVQRESNDLSNWSPFDQLMNLRKELNRLVDSPFPDLAHGTEFFNGWVPPLDLFEDKESLVARIELPGMKKEDIDISLLDGTLTVSGDRKETQNSGPAEEHRSERFHGRFSRSMALPKPVIAEKTKATYKDGILTITLPKTEEAKPKQIEVG
jgi:HSP20 family protein